MENVDLTNYFPPVIVCQPWKTSLFLDKLANSALATIENFQKISFKTPVDFDTKPLMGIFGSVLKLQSSLQNHDSAQIPHENLRVVDMILTKTNEYLARLDKTPYFSELPFTTKAKLVDPLVDMRIYASNLKRAMKPCTLPAKPAPPVGSIDSPIQSVTTLARGFL